MRNIRSSGTYFPAELTERSGQQQSAKNSMFPPQASSDLHTVIAPTNYCWPVTNIQELHESAARLRSRSTPGTDQCELSLASSVDAHLATVGPEGTGWTDIDESGRRVLFVHVLAPQARERSRQLTAQDDAAHGIPLLVTVLLPDLAFNLSEIEAAYGFSTGWILEERFGEAMTDHLITHNGTLYLDTIAACTLLHTEHPALLIALAGALIARDIKIREVLRGTNEALRALDSEVVVELQEARLAVMTECHMNMESIMTIPDDHPQWYVLHIIAQTYETLITDERISFERQFERITRGEVDADAMEIDGATAGCAVWGTAESALREEESSIEALTRMYKQIRITCRRLFRLRQCTGDTAP